MIIIARSNNPSDAQFSMTWPWPEGEAWRVFGTHGYGSDHGIWSSLDMQHGNSSCDWIHNRSCTEETPLVYSMFTGIVSFVTKCQVSIVHSTGWAIRYYHMDNITVRTKQTVQKNEPIGRYAGNYRTAL